MRTRCERRGQGEVGIVIHDAEVFSAFGAGVCGNDVTAYTRNENGRIVLTRWGGGVMLACRSEVVRKHQDGSLALIFRLTNGRFLVGHALGDDGMLFRGVLMFGCGEEMARLQALELSEHWSGIDAEDDPDER